MQPVVEQNNWGAPLQQQAYGQPQQPYPPFPPQGQWQKRNRMGFVGKFKKLKFAVILMLLLQIATLYFLINPINLINQLDAVQVVNKVSSKVSVPPSEVPQVIARVNDGKQLASADSLRKENAIQAEVYKDAQDGDYVLLYSSKMIIYRQSTDTVIYEGNTPAAILQKTQKDLMDKVIAKAKAANVISQDSSEQPQLSSVTDAAKLRQENPTFYSDVAKDDIIALFPTAGKVVLYRSANDSIVKVGNFKLNIN